MSNSTKTLKVNTLKIEEQYVYLEGRGNMHIRRVQGPPDAPTLLMLHGWLATGNLNWEQIMVDMASDYNVISLDHRGHGRGLKCDKEPFKFETCADDYAALITTLGLKNVIVVGYSMGGPIAYTTWQHHPKVVQGLILCNTAYRFPKAANNASALNLLASSTKRIPSVLNTSLGGTLGVLTRYGHRFAYLQEISGHDWRAITQAGVELAKFNEAEGFKKINIPTGMLISKQDTLVDPKVQRETFALIPSRHAFLEEMNGDHFVCVKRRVEFTERLRSLCFQVEKQMEVSKKKTSVKKALIANNAINSTITPNKVRAPRIIVPPDSLAI